MCLVEVSGAHREAMNSQGCGQCVDVFYVRDVLF